MRNKQKKKKMSGAMDIVLEHEIMNDALTQKRMRSIHLYLRLQRLRKLRALERLKRLRSKRRRMMLEAFQQLFDEQLDQLEKEYQLFMVLLDEPGKKHRAQPEKRRAEKETVDDRIAKINPISTQSETLDYQNSLFLLSQLSKEPDSAFKSRVQLQSTSHRTKD